MAFQGNDFRVFRRFRSPLLASAFAALASAQAPKVRCDLQLNRTPGAGAAAACLDLLALQSGGTPVQTAGNATRISTDGIRLCPNAFRVPGSSGADIVFIYDNSGSMFSHYARINPATGDTSFFHHLGCESGTTLGAMTYTTAVGPRTVRHVSSNSFCEGYAGDPYHARARVITQGIDFLLATAPNSTAGAVAFSGTTDHERPPLPLSVPGNADLVKASVSMDSVGATYYLAPLSLATTWLSNPALTKTAKQAIVFLSDGEPNDAAALASWLNRNKDIPIYTIALGDSGVSFSNMVTMSTRTGGRFYRVAPDNIAQMNAVMQEIIQAITVVNLPTSIEVTNSSFAPPMVSRSTGMVRNADSSISLALDSIIPLKQGPNSLSVKITMSPGEVRTFPVSVQADGPVAPASTETLECHPMPTLVLLNPQGKVDSVYPAGTTQYDVRLTRAASDIGTVTVKAASKDSARPGWGDDEAITLPQASSQGGLTVNQRNDYPFNGASANPAKGNHTLEAGSNAEVVLTWEHPRDAREAATFVLPGRKVPTEPGFIHIVRVTDVSEGVVIDKPVKDPIVIRGGAVITRGGGTAVMTHKGVLHNPHGIPETQLNPNNIPTFVFNTASPFAYKVSVYDHLGQFLTEKEGKVDSLRWEQMRAGADSLPVAFSILPVSESGQPFATGVYILRATLTTLESYRQDPGRPMRVKPVSRSVLNRFGYRR